MAKSATIVFYGRALRNEVKFDDLSQRVATFTEFEVLQAIKGVNGHSHTIKQVGGQLPGSRVVYQAHGVPRFSVGEEYVLFLPAASRLGFASPVGLQQGSINVFESSAGKRVHTAAKINTIPPAAPGELPLQHFLQHIQQLSAE
jgi:hypothetical protein